MAYVLTYTLKSKYKKKNQTTFLNERFSSKRKALTFLKKIQKKVYWSQIVDSNARSRHPKPIILFNPPKKKFIIKTGRLDIFFETGLECLGLVLEEDGKQGYDALNFIKEMDILKIGHQKIAFIYDMTFAKNDAHRLSFYPRGFSRKELIELFDKKHPKATLYRMIR